jgi:glycosyltransferase involved in cell wall biosynthesis
MRSKRPLKVAFYDPSGCGGICQYTFLLAEALARSGCDVTVITSEIYELKHLSRGFKLGFLYKRSWLKTLLLKLIPQRPNQDSSQTIARLNGQTTTETNNRVSVIKILQTVRLRITLLRAVIRLLWDGTQVIHFQWLADRNGDLFFIKLLKSLGFKIVYTAHDLVPHDSDTLENRRYYRNVYSLADRLIVHAENIRQEMIELFQLNPSTIWVIPHGSNILFSNESKTTARTRLEIPLDKKVILFFGLIKPYKGLEYLLKAFGRIKEQIDTALLVVAGRIADEDPAMYAHYSRLLSQFAEENPVKCVTDYVPFEQAGNFFSAADVVVLPHVKPSQSGVLFAAIAAGKPVVVTDAGGLSEAVENGRTGFVVPPRDTTAIAEALIKVLQDPAVMERMGREAKALAETRYSWEGVAARTLRLYRSLTDPRSGELRNSQVVLPS